MRSVIYPGDPGSPAMATFWVGSERRCGVSPPCRRVPGAKLCGAAACHVPVDASSERICGTHGVLPVVFWQLMALYASVSQHRRSGTPVHYERKGKACTYIKKLINERQTRASKANPGKLRHTLSASIRFQPTEKIKASQSLTIKIETLHVRNK